MRKWRCIFCAHVYDEKLGDADSGIPPGTPFESLPDDWMCPECGAAKSDYQLIVE
ncbi:MAG: rubredoxin [Rhodocyclaceae bacterium]|jgi:rubredoxin|nr:rubredoxin [Rhodocyclaceae bacterium]